jgi:long-chain fatty acid transport protein
MKKSALFISMLVILTFVCGLVYGSGIDNKTNWSAGYIRTLNRNAVYDNPDAVVYNPAGVVKLEPGLHIGLNNQFLLPNYSHKSAAAKYSTNNPTLLLPSTFLSFNRDRWAAYGAFHITGGGGKLDYDDGVVDINEGIGLDFWEPSGTVKSIYYTGALGGVFAINDVFAVAAGGRIIYGIQEIKVDTANPVIGHPVLGDLGTEIIDNRDTATGYGGVFGLNIAIPVMETNIGIRYETKVKLDWEADTTGGALGSQFDNTGRKDLPAMLALGASIKPLPFLRTEASFNYYFNKGADWQGLEDNVENGWEIGAMGEFAFIPGVKGSLGVLYVDPGADEDSYFYLSPALRSFSVAGGALVDLIPNIALEGGVMKAFYFEDDGFSQGGAPLFPPIPVTLNKSVWIISIGASARINI